MANNIAAGLLSQHFLHQDVPYHGGHVVECCAVGEADISLGCCFPLCRISYLQALVYYLPLLSRCFLRVVLILDHFSNVQSMPHIDDSLEYWS